jgi:hypothetical protein
MHGQFFCFCVLLGKLVTFLVLLPCSIWFLCVHNRQWLPVVTGYSFAILGVRACKFPQFTHDLRLLKFHILLRVFCSCKRLKAYSGIGRRVIAGEQKKILFQFFFFFFWSLKSFHNHVPVTFNVNPAPPLQLEAWQSMAVKSHQIMTKTKHLSRLADCKN